MLTRFPVRVLVNQPIIQLGKISFSMYLFHFAVIELYERLGIVARFPKGDGSSILFYLCVVATTAPLSYLTYIWIERRGVACGNRLITNLEQRAQEDAPSVAKA
jgi:peptidoglycan/LPS O-acetylase OafA/YrhL